MTTTVARLKPIKKRAPRRAYGGLPSVTSVIGAILAKPALTFWAAGVAARAAVDGVLAGGAPDEVVERARKAHLTVRDNAAAAGTRAHEMVEDYLRTGEVPAEPDIFEADDVEILAHAAFSKFLRWWPTSGYSVELLETPFIDEACGFAGTIDFLLRRNSDGALLIADLKTSKGVYDETVVQLGGYALLLSKHGVNVAEGLIVHCPVQGPLSAIPVSTQQLITGSSIFAALFCVFKARTGIKLDLDTEGSIP